MYCLGNVFAHDKQMRESAKVRDPSLSRKRGRDTDNLPHGIGRRRSFEDSTSEYESQTLNAKLLALRGNNDIENPRASHQTSTRKTPRDIRASVTATPKDVSASQQGASDAELAGLRGGFLKCVEEAERHNGLGSYNTAPTSPLRRPINQNDPLTLSHRYMHQHPDWRATLGTQELPIELSDDEDLSEVSGRDGSFLFQDMPEPSSVQRAINESQGSAETQMTLSDSAFDSQLSNCVWIMETTTKVERRKEAYRTAKDPSSSVHQDSRLVSSGGDHLGAEVEL